MRPTFSILCFTVLSGIGYGAWFLQGLAWAIGPICEAHSAASGVPWELCPVAFWTKAGSMLALLFVSTGLLCSLGHLGKPSRAWRALSQWRSSWLSREGVFALLTFVPFVLIAAQEVALWIAVVRAGPDGTVALSGWVSQGGLPRRLLGFCLAAGSLATVFCTANIYASLKPIRAWNDRHVVPAYLSIGLYGGCLLLAAMTVDRSMEFRDHRILLTGTIVLAVACAWLKHRYWRSIDAQSSTTTGHAIGLESLGTVRPLEAPHTEENYLTHEMGFVLARKHSTKLRRIALAAAFLIPALLAALTLVLPRVHPLTVWLALASGIVGLFVERWLFFAEAKHAVTAFYGR
ncbi:DmsC/YnfH family molybdoenzyme membrane anchor subunit [Dokdonella sp.]|uniref:dimethyl sulfoxide reductase anchor subunit family protein n=1 Tax=Dokdonella sp. TaxID=2291710 RepID=UPI00262A930B|nr:DmsC/YnfH family molybdoenzyme membrane anchor subunit [Dokdonella sp.]